VPDAPRRPCPSALPRDVEALADGSAQLYVRRVDRSRHDSIGCRDESVSFLPHRRSRGLGPGSEPPWHPACRLPHGWLCRLMRSARPSSPQRGAKAGRRPDARASSRRPPPSHAHSPQIVTAADARAHAGLGLGALIASRLPGAPPSRPAGAGSAGAGASGPRRCEASRRAGAEEALARGHEVGRMAQRQLRALPLLRRAHELTARCDPVSTLNVDSRSWRLAPGQRGQPARSSPRELALARPRGADFSHHEGTRQGAVPPSRVLGERPGNHPRRSPRPLSGRAPGASDTGTGPRLQPRRPRRRADLIPAGRSPTVIAPPAGSALPRTPQLVDHFRPGPAHDPSRPAAVADPAGQWKADALAFPARALPGGC